MTSITFKKGFRSLKEGRTTQSNQIKLNKLSKVGLGNTLLLYLENNLKKGSNYQFDEPIFVYHELDNPQSQLLTRNMK